MHNYCEKLPAYNDARCSDGTIAYILFMNYEKSLATKNATLEILKRITFLLSITNSVSLFIERSM